MSIPEIHISENLKLTYRNERKHALCPYVSGWCLKPYPFTHKFYNFIFLTSWVMFHCVYCFIVHSLIDGNQGCFYFLAIVNEVAMYTDEQVSLR